MLYFYFQKGPDYGAMIIKCSAGIVIAISLTLIFLVVGNMIYQSLSNKIVLRERVSSFPFFEDVLFLYIFFWKMFTFGGLHSTCNFNGAGSAGNKEGDALSRRMHQEMAILGLN